jgi:21S rRNA (GM2251-2'-O)-methyltransferase
VFSRPKFTPTIDKRIPISIPYTTPASEFLYGSSVVEAALCSRASPRRKLYKLYIYSGENRENEDRDKDFARLARRQGVPVEFKNADWLRMMDKMSGGRPHNGYILEASPLPRLPVVSLGELTTRDGTQGFEVLLDHQSREEAQVNGTNDFVPVPSMVKSGEGRKPFVLLLDSIVDPGNLGGIIRTASFQGVTAIAISSRNSAGFTPVVLKASAGASENVTLFTVNKPAGFIQDSKAAGWKVYAAVAPSTNRTSGMPIALTTDELYNPLEQAPSILMLGNEGEGLRWNLRSKADVELSIEGSKERGGVDSLNVSVATGILCNAFLRKSNHLPRPTKSVEQEIQKKGDLF